MTCEFRQVGSVNVEETTYLVVSLKNCAPTSCSTVRVDQAGSNISYVVRPSKMPWQRPVTAPIVSSISGRKAQPTPKPTPLHNTSHIATERPPIETRLTPANPGPSTDT